MSNVVINVRTLPYYEGTKVLDGNTYKLKFRWNSYKSVWYMDIKGVNNEVDRKGIAMLPGKDLFEIFGYYQLGQLWVIDGFGAGENPDYDNFGSRWTLEYVPLGDL
jgi:hypothetical protein